MPQQFFFCKICGKNTPHELTVDHSLWVCANEHPNDSDCCHVCGEKLDEMAIEIIKALGVNQTICRKCHKPRRRYPRPR